MKNYLLIIYVLMVFSSCEDMKNIDLKHNQHILPLTKSEPQYNASVVDGSTGGSGQVTAYGVFSYPTGWCYVEYDGNKCKVEWTNGIPIVKTFEYTNFISPRYKLGNVSKIASFTNPETEINVNVTFEILDKDSIAIFKLPSYSGQFTFSINIPDKVVTIFGMSNPQPINEIDRSYFFDSFSRFYNITFTTDLINNTINNVNIILNSHPYLIDPLILYTYNISDTQVVFNIAGSLVEETILPNGSTTLVEIIFEDSFTMPL